MPDEPSFTLRSVAAGVFLPALIFEIGIGAIMPMIALQATSLGASIATAGFILTLLAIGQIAGDVPAGALAARVGDRKAMLIAAGLSVFTITTAAVAPNLVTLAAAVLLIGAANAVFMLARQAYLTTITPPLFRARALSTLAGVQRIGTFIGPFAGAPLVHLAGTRAAFWLAVGTTVVTFVVVLAVPDAAGAEARPAHQKSMTSLAVLARHRQVFGTLGIVVFMVGAARGARQTVLPLWTESLGFDPSVTSLIFGISGAVDMLLFYPAGKVMDRRGRLWVAVPSMLLLGASIAVLPLATTVASVTVVAMLIGLGNGIGSGILMTLGADTAPDDARSQYLGVWRLFQDSGNAGGPLVVSVGASLGSLAGGIVAMGAVALASVPAMLHLVPRWSVHANRTTRRAAGLGDDGKARPIGEVDVDGPDDDGPAGGPDGDRPGTLGP